MKLTKEIEAFLDTEYKCFEVARKMEVSVQTIYRRKKRPETFTAKEIQVLKEISGLTEDQIFEKEEITINN